jgi:hypothetical protein
VEKGNISFTNTPESLKTLHDLLLPYGDSDIIIVHFVFEGIIALFENLPTP